jgi:hypothetical protein
MGSFRLKGIGVGGRFGEDQKRANRAENNVKKEDNIKKNKQNKDKLTALLVDGVIERETVQQLLGLLDIIGFELESRETNAVIE